MKINLSFLPMPPSLSSLVKFFVYSTSTLPMRNMFLDLQWMSETGMYRTLLDIHTLEILRVQFQIIAIKSVFAGGGFCL